MQLSGPSIWAAPGKVRAADGEPSSQSVPGVTPLGGDASPQLSLSRSRMQAVGTDSLVAAPGKTVLSLARQSSPPRMVGLFPCGSIHPVHETYRSASGSVSLVGIE